MQSSAWIRTRLLAIGVLAATFGAHLVNADGLDPRPALPERDVVKVPDDFPTIQAAIDFDEHSAGLCANNEIRDNDDDGIEIRLHPYCGDQLRIVIRDNVITGNGENGIQVIDYPELSVRQITIERNYIAYNAMAGIGCMSDANTRENYEGAPIPEPILIVNNTIVGNHYGLTGGANATVMNNVIAHHHRAGLKNVAGRSRLTHNLLWANGDKPEGCRLDSGMLLEADPQINALRRPHAGSPCIDAGAVHIDLVDADVVSPGDFRGTAPDLGAYEIQ